MSECCKLNRRAVLSGGASMMAGVATLPTVAGAHQWSPEFREWMALARTLPDALAADEAWERANPGFSTFDAARTASRPIAMLDKKLEALEWQIIRRPVSSWEGVAELAMLALFYQVKELRPGEHADCACQFDIGRHSDLTEDYQGERPAIMLVQAVAKLALAMGAADV